MTWATIQTLSSSSARSISANNNMIHYSCDRCKRLIETEHELRYLVRIEVQAKFGDDSEVTSDEAKDHLLEIDEILDRQSDEVDPMIDDEVYSRRRFDLCCECYAAFQKNPFGRETPQSLGFSDN